MKRITLDDLLAKQKILLTMLVMLTIAFFSMFATAAETDAGDKTQTERTARDFNHLSTGFPLLGLHSTVECGTCHVAGIFKGTPKNCAGCHTKGMRVVATPKSLKHLVTTEPCEVCHTNAVTFYGARYNHGKATPGQCATCHNGVIATGKVASHSTGNKLTKSCDSCHRTFAWLPSNWNHLGNTAACVTCHVTGGEGAAYVKTAIAGTSPEAFAHNAQNAGLSCESCHRSYTSWSGAVYSPHASGTCSTCHNGSRATGIAQKSGHVAIGSNDCSQCHIGTTTWSGALGGAPANHTGSITASCSVCHVGASTTHVTGSTLHSNFTTTTCRLCHLRTGSTYNFTSAEKDTLTHEGGGSVCSQSGCHKPAGSKGTLYINWD
ncbi:MAG: hypothetical protein Q8O24_01530 [Gallionellaceae bacterium]|nr:hypothetical protein [Gallionellaceae bacterium]